MVLDHDIVGVQKRPSWYTEGDKLWNIATSHNMQLDEIYNYMTVFFSFKALLRSKFKAHHFSEPLLKEFWSWSCNILWTDCWSSDNNLKFISSLFFMMSYPCYITTFVMLLYTKGKNVFQFCKLCLDSSHYTVQEVWACIMARLAPSSSNTSLRSPSLKKRSWFFMHSWWCIVEVLFLVTRCELENW